MALFKIDDRYTTTTSNIDTTINRITDKKIKPIYTMIRGSSWKKANRKMYQPKRKYRR